MYPNREIFPAAPVVLVTAEARLTDAPRLRQQETLDAIAIALEGRFPLTEPVSGMVLENAGPGAPPRMVQRQALVMRNAESTEAVTLTSNSVVVETTAYRQFEDLQATMSQACQALVDANVVPALTRVGLRYIDEIRVPEPIADVRSWSGWIDPGMVGALSIAPEGVPVRGLQGAVAFDLGNGGGLNIGYAAATQGTVVNHRFLRRPPFDPGPFFGLDFDGFVELRPDPAVFLDAVVVSDILAAVHAPIGAAFQQAITDKSRALFRSAIVPGRHSLN